MNQSLKSYIIELVNKYNKVSPVENEMGFESREQGDSSYFIGVDISKDCGSFITVCIRVGSGENTPLTGDLVLDETPLFDIYAGSYVEAIQCLGLLINLTNELESVKYGI